MSKKPGTFEKGNQHGKHDNHAGRRMITQQLISALNEDFREIDLETKRPKPGKSGITKMRKIVDNLIFNATVLGDQAAINAIMDRVEGKPTQAVELTGADGGPIKTEQRTLDPDALAKLDPVELARIYREEVAETTPDRKLDS